VSYYVKNLERLKRGRKLANERAIKHGAGIMTGLRQTEDLQGCAIIVRVQRVSSLLRSNTVVILVKLSLTHT